jgi:hypothetical protein
MESISQFMNNNPIPFTILAVILLIILAGALFGLYKILMKKGGKLGPVNIPAEQQEALKEEISEETKKIILNGKIELVSCLSKIISASVKSGFDKSIIRQELFNKQTTYTRNRFNSIISNITVAYMSSKNSATIKYLEVILKSIFREKIYIPLEKIFKEDRLAEKKLEDLIELHRSLINNIPLDVLKECSYFSNIENSSVDFIKLVENKQEDIKKATVDSIEKAYIFAKEEKARVEKVSEQLDEEIKNSLEGYLGNDIEKISIPETWNNSYPPNDIIGEIR